MLKVAIVGLGTISQIHMMALSQMKDVEIIGLCDINPAKKIDYKNAKFYLDLEEMLVNEKLDIINVCLPHNLHIWAVELAAKYKVNVFLEKPAALNYKEAESAFELENKCGIKIGVCLQNRYNTTTKVLKDAVANNTYGKLKGTKAVVTWQRTMDYYNVSKWRGIKAEAGSGVLMNQTIHTLDLLEYIGGDFKSVNAMINNVSLPKLDIEDTAVAYLKYKNGQTGNFFSTISHCDNSSVEMEFVFENATLKMRDNVVYEVKQDSTKIIAEDQKLKGSKHYYGASHAICIEAFYNSVTNNTLDYVNLVEGSKILKTIDAIFVSSENRKEMEI
ncbi:MAG: Gfo/Idh/MocA family protein [Anaeroplasmataceae bacterium]